MSTTENSNVIDEKKAEETGTSTNSPDFKGFITNYMISIIFTIGIAIFIIGGLGLYTTKVAQSNILPDDIELAPYTIFDRIVDDNCFIDINVIRPSFFSENKETLSQKVKFNSQEYLDSFNNSFLCSLKKSANPETGLFANAPLYFSFVYDNLIANNFFAINKIFFYLSYFPESIIMILYGLFGIFIWFGLYFFNVCISIFYHIMNIPQLFRSTTDSNDKQWESNEDISFIRFTKLILFFILWLPVGALSTFVMPAFFTVYGLISPLFAKYDIKNGKNDNTFSNFIYSNLVYKKMLFFVLATISLFINGTKYLGNNAIIGIIVAVIFAYFMGLYANDIPEPGTDGFSLKIRQHMKQCKVFDKNSSKLVEVCQKNIPIDDKTYEKLMSSGNIRSLTKSKGGTTESHSTESHSTESHSTESHSTESHSTELSALENKLEILKQELDEMDNFDFEDGTLEQTQSIENIRQQIQDVSREIKTMSQTGQKGGKTNKTKHIKFNIRWT